MSYKDWASDNDLGLYVASRMVHYSEAVEKGLSLPKSISRRGRYIEFNEAFRNEFWRDYNERKKDTN